MTICSINLNPFPNCKDQPHTFKSCFTCQFQMLTDVKMENQFSVSKNVQTILDDFLLGVENNLFDTFRSFGMTNQKLIGAWRIDWLNFEKVVLGWWGRRRTSSNVVEDRWLARWQACVAKDKIMIAQSLIDLSDPHFKSSKQIVNQLIN